MSQGPGTEKTRRLRSGDGRSPSEKDSGLRALTGKNWGNVSRGDSWARPPREGAAWYSVQGPEKRAVVGREDRTRARVFSLWAWVSLSLQEGMEGFPGSPATAGTGRNRNRRSLGEQWEVLREAWPKWLHVTLALSPSPSAPSADSKLPVVPDSLLQ